MDRVSESDSAPAHGPPRIPRRGFSARAIVFAFGLLIGVPAISWAIYSQFSGVTDDANGIMMHVASYGDFIHDVTERGNLESSSNVEIVSKVKSKSYTGVQILWVIEEGKMVEPGEKLVELDSSALDDQLLQQQIVCYTSQATVKEIESVKATAEFALDEYKDGQFGQDKLTIEIERDEAQEESDRRKAYLEFSRRLERKGYVSSEQLKADEAAYKQALNKVRLAKEKLRVLIKKTWEKEIQRLTSEIEIAVAKLAAAKASNELDEKQLELIEEQIANCTILSPDTGQVVYANEQGRYGNNETVIEAGTMIRERQVIIRLPDPTRMQVNAKINEARVARVEEGMKATIRLDAFPKMDLTGVVKRVADYPAGTSWMRSNVKEYEAIITIDNPPDDLRPGLTAEVKIRVNELKDVQQVPVQAVIEHGGTHYCVVYREGVLKSRPVTIGHSNDKFVVITSGLKRDEKVALNAGAYRDDIGLPELLANGAKGKQRPGSPGKGHPGGGGKPGQGGGSGGGGGSH